ncbi:unnamed protein product (macronuclear) [Paramecium tetraurelia]|uniref:Uncharacterized protein n=1 Tax=Paramecium tetraurelia TaxID=5888 RepID=A0D7M9_PARTE|nr:uncharacterized protein GSPATT00014013001 [Paramecium tetraurelia]CAK79046.1 unnamed protein product [Paramecium tetraurelia]|eukprot:XP_001446443.1 hypothetical protein (macronuclear) [Paramecium tetraurelia strain d4-2]
MRKQLLQTLSEHIESDYIGDEGEGLQCAFTLCLQDVPNQTAKIPIDLQ